MFKPRGVPRPRQGLLGNFSPFKHLSWIFVSVCPMIHPVLTPQMACWQLLGTACILSHDCMALTCLWVTKPRIAFLSTVQALRAWPLGRGGLEFKYKLCDLGSFLNFSRPEPTCEAVGTMPLPSQAIVRIIWTKHERCPCAGLGTWFSLGRW